MPDKELDEGKRRFLVAATGVAGGIAGVASAVPFVASMLPSERAKAAGAPVEADISNLGPGEKITVEWRGQPVWIVRRTKEMLDAVKASDDKVADPKSARKPQELTPEYARNEYRSV
jgi:ubiquinol-cytochrome c reductase iron-sulfur subunit